jgi:predicted nucleic acid-binding protein
MTLSALLKVDRVAATELCEDLAAVAHGQTVHFLWRPWLRDPNDDLVVEAVVASVAKYIVTHNIRGFTNQNIESVFGITILRPQEMLALLERGYNEQPDR